MYKAHITNPNIVPVDNLKYLIGNTVFFEPLCGMIIVWYDRQIDNDSHLIWRPCKSTLNLLGCDIELCGGFPYGTGNIIQTYDCKMFNTSENGIYIKNHEQYIKYYCDNIIDTDNHYIKLNDGYITLVNNILYIISRKDLHNTYRNDIFRNSYLLFPYMDEITKYIDISKKDVLSDTYTSSFKIHVDPIFVKMYSEYCNVLSSIPDDKNNIDNINYIFELFRSLHKKYFNNDTELYIDDYDK